MLKNPKVQRSVFSIEETFKNLNLDLNEAEIISELIGLEEAMRPDEAMKVLGLTPEQAGDADTVKKAYRDASRKHHPDLGGDPEEMKRVNAAYEVLQGGGVGSGAIPRPKTDWAAMDRKYRQLAIFVKDYLSREVQVDSFLEYLKTWEPGLEAEISLYPEVKEDDLGSPHYAGMKVKFKTPDGKRSLTADFMVRLSDVSGAALGGEGMTVPLVVTTHVYVDGKNQKIKQNNYTFTSDKSVVVDPSSVFPKVRMGKIFSGEARKGSKFSRRDMQSALVSELNAKLNGDEPYAHIPIGEDEEGNPLEMVIGRQVFIRVPSWNSYGVWRRTGKFQISRMIKDTVVSYRFPEDYNTITTLKEIQKAALAAKPSDKIQVVMDAITAEKNKVKESVGEASEPSDFSKFRLKSQMEAEDEIVKPAILGDLDVRVPKIPFSEALKGWKEQIEGGLAAGKDPSDFPQDQLEAGYWIEFEHTQDPMMAIEIGMDHLEENKLYYSQLVAMELKADAQKSDEKTPTVA